ATFAFALAQSGLADEIVLVDNNEKLAQGQVLDLVHGQSFFPTVFIRPGGPSEYGDADIIVITAGRAQRPGETRLQLLKGNAAIIQAITKDIVEQRSPAVVLVVANPVDIMTYVALKASGWEKGRVIGSGTVLDSARLRHILSTFCNVDVHNVHGYVLGEHGDSEFVAWSMTNLAGIEIDMYCPLCGKCSDWIAQRARIEEDVRKSAYHIIDYKGATNFAVSLVMVTITEAILRGQNSVLSVSTLLEGEYGINDVCFSIPCIISSGGVHRLIQGPLKHDEFDALARSAEALKSVIRDITA
ncbi:MAG: L-lactate dehydrogenase, partial [Deltaproteobacteria bacterium]|nr:L-lactate dehydrogenase [Deltaproteobacteria bacterium]